MKISMNELVAMSVAIKNKSSRGLADRYAATALAVAVCAGLGATSAMAASGNWNGLGGDNNWGTSGNWSSGTIAGSTTAVNSDVVNIPSYGGSTVPARTTINLDDDRYIGNIDIWSPSDITIESTSGKTLYWNGNSNYVRHAYAFTLNVPVVTLTGTRISPQLAGTKQIFNDTVTFDPSAAPGTNLNFQGANGLVQFNDAISGPGGLYSNGGTARIELNAANSFTGGSSFNATNVTVALNAAGAWPANLALNFGRGGNLEINTTNAITGTSSVTLGPTSSYVQVMTANKSSNYSGNTTISTPNGALWANNPNDGGSATGSGSVSDSGLLGGNGYIINGGTNGVTLNSGGKLSPGASAGAVGTLTVNLGSGGLSISSPVNAVNTQSLLFDLATPASSDKVSLLGTSVLKIGTGKLEWDDFAFNLPGGPGSLAGGTYTLFDSSQLISGSLGSSLSGTLDGKLATLSLADGGKDIVLTVVPEPATLGLLAIGGLGLLARRRRIA